LRLRQGQRPRSWLSACIPNSYEIIIPNVVPGTYRIADKAIVSGAEVSGFVLVEVD
jgi:hypothetical protein